METLVGLSAILRRRKPVPTAALVTRTTRWPSDFNFRTDSTRDERLDKSGKCVTSSQMEVVPTLTTIVKDDFEGLWVF